ncbi:MAG TPA: ABC transporter ATP-binding protein [Pyrinomonadaceae bacterium]|nr:ABC transporter ATP-binding protein [Pyrinomonadaceae bacterium]
MNILETHDLVHSFSNKEVVLKGISLSVEESSIYGFLGPNGAGKTTTLRLILGLLAKQEGSISVFGKDFEKNRVESLRRIGSLIESPSIYSHLTAEENLRVLQKVYRCSRSRIGEVLELVGLASTGKKRAGQFSLGMKQRLSIAIALLNSPSLLILDEPTNGLDPNGMIEIRELLRRLNQEHRITILISSHLLAEIDRLVSHIGIINKGTMMFQGTLEELKAKQQQSVSVVFETSDSSRTREVLVGMKFEPTCDNGRCTLPALPRETIADINRQLVMKGIDIYEVSVMKNDLERIFMDMVSG